MDDHVIALVPARGRQDALAANVAVTLTEGLRGARRSRAPRQHAAGPDDRGPQSSLVEAVACHDCAGASRWLQVSCCGVRADVLHWQASVGRHIVCA